MTEVLTTTPAVDFWEIAPENWMARGYEAEYQLDKIRERYSVSCHGLSLSIGSPDPLDEHFVRDIKKFLDRFNISRYSEHLSYCSASGHLYDLLPIPFAEQAADYVAARVRRVQDILERPVVLENVSYYTPAATEMSELAFIRRVLEQADCELLLDVNNVYVNSVNHKYDPYEFIAALPSERITYGHIAGHHEEAHDFLIDTHGADVRSEVYELLAFAYQQHGDFPVLLERDFNIPPLNTLLQDVEKVKAVSHELA